MSLEDFNKLDSEQKKKLFLFALLGVLGVYVLVSFLLTPIIHGHRAAVQELSTLQADLDKAQRLMTRESIMRDQYDKVGKELEVIADQYVPPADNPLSWVAEQVYGSARGVGIEIESVADLGTPSLPWARQAEDLRAYIPYRVRVVTQCSYSQLVELVRALETQNPYLNIAEVNIVGQAEDVERHMVRLSVDWPFRTMRDRPKKAASLKGVHHG